MRGPERPRSEAARAAAPSASRRHSSEVKLVPSGQPPASIGGTVVEVTPPGAVVVGWPGDVVVVTVTVVEGRGRVVVVVDVVVVAVAPTGAVHGENSEVLPSWAVAVAVRMRPAGRGSIGVSEKLAWPAASVVTVERAE